MTGASLALIFIPIASTAGLVVWLIMVFSADGHARQANRNPADTHPSPPGNIAERLPEAVAAADQPIEVAAGSVTAGQFRPAA